MSLTSFVRQYQISRCLISPYRRCRISVRYLTDVKQTRSTLKECYTILKVPEDANLEQIRESYLKLAKEYHPDSGSIVADAVKFTQVEQAYRTVVTEHQRKEENEKDEEDITIFDINHTAPQHRQYLNNEGYGMGTPSQRQKQYEQYKVHRASENVSEYRTSKLAAQYENTMVVKDKREAKKKLVRGVIDRLVDDLIAESMSKGDFDDLPGKGKPLNYSNHNPMIDTATHNLNRILIDSGYVPQWVSLEREIVKESKDARAELMMARVKAGPEPLSAKNKLEWDRRMNIFTESVDVINKKINRLNMLVPSLQQQIVPYKVNKEISKIFDKYNNMLKNGEIEQFSRQQEPIIYKPLDPKDRTRFRDVINEIKAFFSSLYR